MRIPRVTVCKTRRAWLAPVAFESLSPSCLIFACYRPQPPGETPGFLRGSERPLPVIFLFYQAARTRSSAAPAGCSRIG